MGCNSFRWEYFVGSVGRLRFISVGIVCHFCRWVVIRFGRGILSVLSAGCDSFRLGDSVWVWRDFVSKRGEIKQLVAKKCLP